MTKPMSPLLKPENRRELIEKAMQSITDKQAAIMKQADEIIGDVSSFEKNVHKKFVAYVGNK